jgi:membrane-bound ClpP family serine protease
MNFFININLAYLLIVVAVMLAITNILSPKALVSANGIVICLGEAAFALYHFIASPWALVVTALSPLPYFFAIHQTGNLRHLLLALTAIMLVFGSAFLFVDKNGHPAINPALMWLVSIICAEFIWVATERRLNTQGGKRGINLDPMVGIIGRAVTNVFDIGLVEFEGETWSARSDHPILAGSTVRILKNEGMILVVKKVEKLIAK